MVRWLLILFFLQGSCLEALIWIEQADLQSNLDQVVNVINLAYKRQPFNREDRTRITLVKLKELLLDEENKLFVAISEEDEICGTILVHQCELSMGSVHPAYQGQGIGLQLLQRGEHEIFKNYDHVYLKEIPRFQERLIQLYEQAGYHSFGEYEPLSPEKLDRIEELLPRREEILLW
jgi:ribosomal protein S18 acetylase RimI-like enzyme